MPREALRSRSATVDWLAQAITSASRSAQFCVAGCLETLDPGMVLPGLGACRFPLKPKVRKDLIGRCHVAGYGQGTKTLVDTTVRNTLELESTQFQLSEAWNAAIAETTQRVAAQLGLPAEQVEARLYKLLVYEKGGFFLLHRDSEKLDGMVASLVVVLPNAFEGGALIVRHGNARQTLTFDEAARGQAPCYAAFYADCAHEVQRVTRGVRVCLAYHLLLRGAPRSARKSAAPSDPVARSMRAWVARQPAEPLVFALEHYYTQHGLSLDLLKGADRRLADTVIEAAERADCLVHLAQVSRHLSQFADDGSFADDDYWHRRESRRHGLEIGETYEDELNATEWVDVEGRKRPWGALPLQSSAIVASVPLDEWKPTSEDFEGYTGNAGNTLDRWYHRSALVVWDRAHHYEVIAAAGPASSIPLFSTQAATLANTPANRLDDARDDAIRFARAIIARWPSRSGARLYRYDEGSVPLEEFPSALRALRDRDTVALFLTTLAERDQALKISALVLAVCREFGWNAFAPQLRQLLTTRRETHGWEERQDLPLRDVEWLSAFCCDHAADADQLALAHELSGLAVERFCQPLPKRTVHFAPHGGHEASVAERSLPLLIKALAASERTDDLARMIRFVQEAPQAFRMDDCQVPALTIVVPWAQKHLGAVPPPVADWLSDVRRQLEAATRHEPKPPADWSRPAEVACGCQYCAQLNAFLADSTTEVGRIRAAEDHRRHVLEMIRRHQCDVKDALERRGSPYSLVLTKTVGSYQRAVKRFADDRKLLSALP